MNLFWHKKEAFSPCFYYNVNIIEILFCGREKFFNQLSHETFATSPTNVDVKTRTAKHIFKHFLNKIE